jgi:hypothetical protein
MRISPGSGQVGGAEPGTHVTLLPLSSGWLPAAQVLAQIGPVWALTPSV